MTRKVLRISMRDDQLVLASDGSRRGDSADGALDLTRRLLDHECEGTP